MTQEKKNFIRDLTSIHEHKVSALMIFFIPTLVTGLVITFLKGDVPPNLAYIIMAMIGGISSINIFVAGKNGSIGTGNMANMNQYGGYGGYNSYGYNNYQNTYGDNEITNDTVLNTNDNSPGI